MQKKDVRRLTTQICNFVLVHGEFWKTELKLKDKLLVYDFMYKRLLKLFTNFLVDEKTMFESYEDLIYSEIPDEMKAYVTDEHKQKVLALSFSYGSDWNPIDFSEIRNHLKLNYNYILKDEAEKKVNKEEHFTFIKALVHIIYRNTILEDIHVRSSVLTDDVMKKCNIDFMNRFAYVFYELCISHDSLEDFWFILDDYENKTKLNPLTTKALLNKFK